MVLIDEADLLSAEQEGMRMLTNHDMGARSPPAGLLTGQPTLRRRIKTGTLATLDQRIALRYTSTEWISARPPGHQAPPATRRPQ